MANDVPTQLTRATQQVKDANRGAALRGQPKPPQGYSLDEYPFASSVEGGEGAFVRAVPVGEQNYQGGVLSRFYQLNDIQVGDKYGVRFVE